MDRKTFIIVMRVVHNALFKMHAPQNADERQVLNELINTYISMIAGFHQWLYEELRTYLLSNKDITDQDLGELYDTLAVEPAGTDQ